MKKTSAAILIGLLGCAFLGIKLDAAEAPQKIGIAWESKSAMADRVTAGFTNAMKLLAPQIDLELQKDLKDVAALGETAKRFEKEKSAVVFMRSTGAKYLGQNKLSIPGFFGACNDPVELGILKNSAAPEGNCSGVTYAIPYAVQFEILTKVLPQMKSVLLLVQDGHPTSILNQQGTKTACESLKIQYNDKACKTKEEAIAAAKEVEAKGVVVILGSQALLIDNGGAIALAVKCPVISYTEKPVMDGALCGLVADDVKLGRMLAESIVNVLLKGASIHQTPVKVDSQPQLLINTDTAERIGLAIPFEILESAKRIQK
jgi:putative ABC transport system substrate-binding protein